MAELSTQDKYVFTWKIKNFLSCHIAYDDKIVSPTFEVPNFPVKNWELWLYPKGNSEQDYSQDRIIVLLMRKKPDKDSESVVFDVTLELLNIDGCVLRSGEIRNCEMKQSGRWGCCFQTINALNKLVKSWDEDTLILRCIMTNIMTKKEDKVHYKEFEAVTVINVDRYIFKWDVSNTGCFDWSESVSVPNSVMSNLKIIFSVAPDETVKINIQVLNDSLQDEIVVFRMKFLSASGIKLASFCEIHSFESNESGNFPTFVSLKDLYFGNFSPPCYKYTFIFKCIVSKKSISWSKIENLTSNLFVKKESTTLASFPSSLQHNFRELFINKKYSDVKLRVNRTDFPSHKVVLASRSPVFSAMFDQDMLENQSGVVHIEDMEEETVQNLLEYMYTDVVKEMNCIEALNLLLAADKYQILNLKDKCTSAILSLLTTENVCEVIVVADMINHESLKTFSLNVIFANASKVLSAPNWYLWIEEHMRLATEIMRELSKYLKSEEKD